MRNKQTKQFDPIIYGKMPPSNQELEKWVIGAILFEPNKIELAKKFIKDPDVFYYIETKTIYKSIIDLYNSGKIPDVPLVTKRLREIGELEIVGGAYYISKVFTDTTSSSNIQSHIQALLELYLKRKIIKISGDSIQCGYDESLDAFDSITALGDEINELKNSLESIKDKSLDEHITDYMISIDEDIKMIDDGIGGVKTFISEFDNVIKSFQGGNIYVLAARTSMGKTAFEIQVTLNQSIHFDVAVWNGELTPKRMIRRYVSNIAGITSDDILEHPKENVEKITDALNELRGRKLILDNTRNIFLEELLSKIRYWVKVKKCKIVWLDYLSVIKLPYEVMRVLGSKTEQVGYIIDKINEVAFELNVPIILLVQVNRDALKNGDKKPTLGNLRDSGSIEERVYHVSFLHRPEYYGEQEYEGKSTENMLQIITAKNGDGKNNITTELEHQLMYSRVLTREQIFDKYKNISEHTDF